MREQPSDAGAGAALLASEVKISEFAILVAEDEMLTRLFMHSALENAGWTVFDAANGDQAIDCEEQHIHEIAALVTDIRLGSGPDGWEVACHARELRSDIAVIYVTGDSADQWADKGVPQSVLLQKPFYETQLVSALATLLKGS